MLSDNELIAKLILHQDQNAFAELVTRHQSAIRQFVRRLTAGDAHQADDIAQETFLLAYQKIATFKAEGSFKSWLHTIAYRQFLKQLSKYQTVSWDDEQPLLVDEPQSALEADILAEKLMSALKPDERAVMTLFMSAQMSHSEIVTITGMPLGTVKSHIQRAKEKLHKLVERGLLVA